MSKVRCCICQGQISSERKLAFPRAVTCSPPCSLEHSRRQVKQASRRQAAKRREAPALYAEAAELLKRAQEYYRAGLTLRQEAVRARPWWRRLRDRALRRSPQVAIQGDSSLALDLVDFEARIVAKQAGQG